PEVVSSALKEMFRQKGSNLKLDGDGVAESGLIIRHLILPGHIENSMACLRFIAEELSPSIHVSLMSQYSPNPEVMDHPQLGRYLTQKEYDLVLEEFYRLGLFRGWMQDLRSSGRYLPDFNRSEVFG
ncbi:MAG: radical SAM protein, partial [Dehalococcoidia bacterium]